MKKLIVIAVALFALVACSVREGGVQTVRFYLGGVRSGDLGVKSVSDADVVAALGATAPSGVVSLSLQSTSVSTRHFTVRTGEEASIPIGEYRVTGRYIPSQKVGTVRDNSVYREPEYTVSAVVDVRDGVEEYVLPASYSCWALVVDKSEVSAVSYKLHGTLNYTDISVPAVSGDVGLFYVSTEYSWDYNQPVTWRFQPVDEVNFESREYDLATKPGGNGNILVESGKWYLFGPGGVIRQDGVMSLEFGEWQKGR